MSLCLPLKGASAASACFEIARGGWTGRYAGSTSFLRMGKCASSRTAGRAWYASAPMTLKAGSRATLWKRLSQHKGMARSGGGNHRGSIFRLIVGTTLLNRDGLASESWDNRQLTAPRQVRLAEQNVERMVSAEIGAMPFLWLDVSDDAGAESERGIIERGSIALLSNWQKEPIDPPSDSWLGSHCNRERVRVSGLWNSNHVDEIYDPQFLDVLERRVELLGRCG